MTLEKIFFLIGMITLIVLAIKLVNFSILVNKWTKELEKNGPTKWDAFDTNLIHLKILHLSNLALLSLGFFIISFIM